MLRDLLSVLANGGGMRRSVAALILTLALFCNFSGVTAQPGLPLDPRATPTFPAEPPPPIPPGPAVTAPGGGTPVQHSINVVAGWSLMSFPYGSVRKVEGLSRMLLRMDQGGFVPIDPVHEPGALSPGLAYLAWAPQAESIRIDAVPAPVGFTRLHPGWNLMANPTLQGVVTANLTLTRPGGSTRLATETADPSLKPGQGWLFNVAGVYGPNGLVKVDIRAPRATMPAGTVGWIFAWTDLDWNWNVVPPPSPPTITAVKPAAAAPGETVRVLGSGFGEAGEGEVTVGGITVPSTSIASWSPSEIRMTLPAGSRTGGILVMKDRFPSRSVAFQVRAKAAPPPKAAPAAPKPPPPAPRPAAGTLEGKVADAQGKPLADALVSLENGQQALSNQSGAFRINDVPVGRHIAYISHVGYKTGSGQITIEAGKSRSLGAKLTPVGSGSSGSASASGSAEKSTTLYVKCWAFTASGVRCWPKGVEVWESGNTSHRWKEVWWNDRGDTYRELSCPGVLVGRTYQVRVVWSTNAGGERVGKWDPRIWKEYQVENYERPN